MRIDTIELTRFHVRASIRLAYRVSIPFLGAWIVAAGVSHDPAAFVANWTRGAARLDAGLFVPGVLSACSLAVASWAAPRAMYGVRVWLGQLPVTMKSHTNAIVLGLMTAQMPVLLMSLALWLTGATTSSGADISRLAAIPLSNASAAWLALPASSPISRPLAALALGLSIQGSPMGLLIASAAVSILFGSRRCLLRLPRRRAGTSTRRLGARGATGALIFYRAMGARILSVFGLASLPLLATALFVENNALPAWLVSRSVRLAGGLALAAAFIGAAQTVLTRRLVWRWHRSLPTSSRRRVLDDTLAIAGLSLPILGFAFVLSSDALLPMIALVPYLAVRSAAALRVIPDADVATLHFIAAELFLVAGMVAMAPAAAVIIAAATYPAFHHAAARDRDLRVSRWRAREHLSAGDAQALEGA